MRNPPWSRDELIVALEFYLRHSPSIPDKRSTAIAELSNFLNRLGKELHGETSATYRNPSAVYLKMMNLRRFDTEYAGRGMRRGNKDEEAVWNLYSADRLKLVQVTEGIKSLVLSEDPLPPKEVVSGEEEQGEEGQLLTRAHRYRERDSRLVKRKKDRVLSETGTLRCAVCDFDFSTVYGKHGRGFIECHHTRPLSDLRPGEKTKLSDLSLVCSNCHRMIHWKRPWLTVEQLKAVVRLEG